MIPKGKSAILAGVVWSFHWTSARRGVLSAFVPRRLPIGHPWSGGIPAHRSRCLTAARRSHATPLFSATDKADKRQQLSDIDARVIDELLSDAAFLESLMEQEVQLEGEAADDGQAGVIGNNTGTDSSSGSALGLVGEAPSSPYASVYESATMQAVEGVQLSVKGIVAKLSAAFESAGIYIANRAQMDSKVMKAVAGYASTQAAAGTSRLLLAASGAASPALLLMGVNTTETQAALNDSVQLLSMGIVPDSLGFSPKLLSSLKDFDDDDKRLDAAFRRQRRRRSKPLPARLLGSLPSTINKAADLAYEVEQEVKYERAGSRTNKLLRPIGVSLPQAKEKGLLMGRTPSESEVMLLEARETNVSSIAADLSPTQILGPSVSEITPAADKGRLLRDASARREPMPTAPHPFRASGRLRREGAKVMEEQNPTITGVQPSLATMPASQLSKRITSIDEEVRLQARGVRSANAVLCSTEPIIAGLAKSSEREEGLLEELKNVTRDVQQMYVLAEMSEAVEAAERHLGRLGELSANVVRLAIDLQAYVAAAHARNGRLESVRLRLLKVRDRNGNPNDLKAADLEVSSEDLNALQAFDYEVVAWQEEAKVVGRLLAVVRQESLERARNEAENAHEYALLAACRLWDASSVEGVGKRAKSIDGIRPDLNTMQNSQMRTPVLEPEGVKSMGVASEVGQGNLAMASGAELLNGKVRPEQSQATEDGATSEPSTDGAPPDLPVEDTIAMLATSGTRMNVARTPVPLTAAGATAVDTETTVEQDQSPSSVEVVRARVVYDATVMNTDVTSRSRSSERDVGGTKRSREGLLPEGPIMTGSEASSIEVVVDRSSSYVDIEVEVEDDLSEPTRIGLKFLDVSALLIEKVLFVGLPTLVSGGSLVWERVDNALNGAKGRKGWKLLKRLKKDSNGLDDTAL